MHEDGTASLSIKAGDEAVHRHRHAGGKVGAVLGKVGLRTRGSIGNNGNGNGHSKTSASKKIVAIYDYRDESGACSTRPSATSPKTSVSGCPRWKVAGRGAPRACPGSLPLAGVAGRRPGRDGLRCGRGRDADRLAKLGLVSTTNVGGAGKWKPKYNQHLAGRPVAILPDNDEAGQHHGEKGIALKAVAASVKVVVLPGLPEKGDVSDWLDAGGTVEELQLVATVPVWKPSATPQLSERRRISRSPTPALPNGSHYSMATMFATVFAWGKWLCWDGTRWKIDDGGMVDQLGKQTVRSILREAADEPDDERRKALPLSPRAANPSPDAPPC